MVAFQQSVLAILAGSTATARSAVTQHPPSKATCRGGSFMTQWIDHSNHSAGTFQQQVQVLTEHFKPGGPILFFQGEESTEMTCVVGSLSSQS